MDFALTEEQLELQAMVREFVEKEIVPYTDEMDKNNACRPEIIKKSRGHGAAEPSCPGRIWRTGP